MAKKVGRSATLRGVGSVVRRYHALASVESRAATIGCAFFTDPRFPRFLLEAVERR